MKMENNQEFNVNELVRIEQMPKVFEQLDKIGEFVSSKLEGIENLECTEENKKEVKNKRTEINKTLEVLENKRKEIKNIINEPYKAFEEKYNSTVKIQLENASELLGTKISEIEAVQKQEKEQEARDYFEEYAASLKIDFVEFEQASLKINLNTSLSSLRDAAKEFLDKIDSDLKVIETQESKEEILIEYKNNLNLAQSISTVSERHKALEELKKKSEEQKIIQEKEEESIAKVDAVLSAPEEIEKSIEELSMTFTVYGTREQLKAIKAFLESEGIKYE